MSLKETIQQQVDSIWEECWAIRTHLHQNPELSFEEFNTSKFIQSKLSEWNIPFTPNVCKTGIIGIIEGEAGTGKTIALRADLDALPIQEENSGEHVSKIAGRMHACGHDFHSASLLGVVKILDQNKHLLKGKVKFIFQPGEEKLPGGASLLIKEGVLTNPTVDTIFAQHVFPELEAGKVGFRGGMYMASCDEIHLTIKGFGGHGAMPHTVIDTVFVASTIVTTLQNIVSRKCNPTIPSVLSFGKFAANGATNVIPSEVKLEGTFRTLNEVWRAEAHVLIKKQIEGICESFGATGDVDIRKGYPFLQNDEKLTEISKQNAIEYLGAENVVDLPIRLTAEDFSYYSQEVPACFYRTGVRSEEKGITYGVHHPKFDIEPEAMKVGIGVLAYSTIKQLS